MNEETFDSTAGRVDETSRASIINLMISAIETHYFSSGDAARMAAAMREHLGLGRYDHHDDAEAFVNAVTADIQAIVRDKHIRLRFDKSIPGPPPTPTTQQSRFENLNHCVEANFGIEKVERLPLNIGLLDLRGFMEPTVSGEMIAAAMTLVANCAALIIDLRKNNGGHPASVALVTSYLLDERTHLNTFHYREGEPTEQSWTASWVPGKLFGGQKPLYLLVSNFTFSGGEEFAYNLKYLKRATIVGETTRGGAHPGNSHWLMPHFSVFVPVGRPISPITNGNWEGVGVDPDVRVGSADALRVSQLLALDQLASESSSAPRKAEIADRIRQLKATAPD